METTKHVRSSHMPYCGQTAHGGSDCVICVGDRSESPRIEIDQVIEGLAYHRAKGRVEIRLFFVVHNPTNENAGFRVVHRGDVEAELRPFTFETDDAVAETISALYSARLKPMMEISRRRIFIPG